MLKGIDISGWQGDIDLSKLDIDFVIVKATEGTGYVNKYCDPKIQQAIKLGKKWGFYHFAKGGDPIAEANHFIDSCLNYFHHGIPVLDFEADAVSKGVDWARQFLYRVYERTGVRPLIYMSQSVTTRFDWSAVAKEFGLWVAKYPNVKHPNLDYSADFGASIGAWDFMAIWQYASDGRINGYAGNLDLDHAYMTLDAWDRYAGVQNGDTEQPNVSDSKQAEVLENDRYKITIEEK